ncbi:MAG: hypothetical protein AMJ43_07785 [Coxiella sp. DG_40]|nr:MAG: hypothetical protein AMJ43_07785 [Coxiella sp. DG_40]
MSKNPTFGTDPIAMAGWLSATSSRPMAEVMPQATQMAYQNRQKQLEQQQLEAQKQQAARQASLGADLSGTTQQQLQKLISGGMNPQQAVQIVNAMSTSRQLDLRRAQEDRLANQQRINQQLQQQYLSQLVAPEKQRDIALNKELETATRSILAPDEEILKIDSEVSALDSEIDRANAKYRKAVVLDSINPGMNFSGIAESEVKDLESKRKRLVEKGNKIQKRVETENKALLSLSIRISESGLSELAYSVDTLDNLIGDKGGIEGGTGFLEEFFTPDAFLGQKAQRTRQTISRVKNAVLKARSGGAVTENEESRLLAELGKNTDQGIRNAVKDLKIIINNQYRDIAAGYPRKIYEKFAKGDGYGNPFENEEEKQAIIEQLKKRGLK